MEEGGAVFEGPTARAFLAARLSGETLGVWARLLASPTITTEAMAWRDWIARGATSVPF